MHNNKRCSLIDLLLTTADGVEDAARRLPTNMAVGSPAWFARKTLLRNAASLYELAASLTTSGSSSGSPGSARTSPRGGPGAAAPKPTHPMARPHGLTPRTNHGGPPAPEAPYEPPQDWSQDTDLAFEALGDEDYTPEDAICGP